MGISGTQAWKMIEHMVELTSLTMDIKGKRAARLVQELENTSLASLVG